MELAVLRITDGTDYVDLVGPNSAFKIKDWKPVMPNPKGGGVWADSPFQHGRQLVHRVYENTTDNLTLVLSTGSQDFTIAEARKARQLLQKAVDYWTTRWATEFVWIEARGSAETNIRYAVIKDFRAPGDSNPFGNPFFACPSVLDEFQLSLEHDFWQGTQPGTGECVSISAQSESHFPYALEFAGGAATDRVDCLSAAALDNMTASASGITIEAWVRADGFGGANNGRIMDKISGTGWFFYINSAAGLACQITAPTPALSTSGLDEFTADGLWHHVAATYNDTGDRKIRLFIDGNQVTSYGIQQAAVGVLTSDAAANLGIGNNIAGLANCWDGGIGWCRIRNGIYYTVAFTPPPRCILPVVQSGTYAIWICEGTGATAYNKVGTAGTDGTITGAVWVDECETAYGREAVCSTVGVDDAPFVSNARWGMLSHVFYLDASGPTYSANLLASALPYNLLPQPFAVGDIIYFGSDRRVGSPPGAPFMAVALDLSTIADAITTIAWEYWNGAWVAIPGITSTEGNLLLGVTGVNVVHFSPPADWTTTNVQGCNGFLVRARITAVAAPSTGGTQQNRHPYAVSAPFLEVAADQIGGDIEALIQQYIYPRNALANHGASRIIYGGRSVERGEEFTAYLNIYDGLAANPFGVVVTCDTGSFVVDSSAPGGGYYQALGDDTVAFFFPQYLVNQYKGYFRVLLRNYQSGGAQGDWRVRVRSPGVTGNYRAATLAGGPSVDFPNVTDCGILPIFPDIVTELGSVFSMIVIDVDLTVGAGTLSLIDLALIPVDEYRSDVSTTSTADDDEPFRLDSLLKPRDLFMAEKFDATTGFTNRSCKNNSAGPFVLPRAKNVRLWYMMLQYISAGPAWAAYTNDFMSPWINKSERYFTHRGNS